MGDVKEVTEKVVEKGADITEKVVENFNLFGAIKNVVGTVVEGVESSNKASAEAHREAKIAEAGAEGLKKLLEEKENQIKKLEERLQKKDEKIEKLEAKVEKLESKVEVSQDRLIAQVEEIAKSRSSSPVPFSNQ